MIHISIDENSSADSLRFIECFTSARALLSISSTGLSISNLIREYSAFI